MLFTLTRLRTIHSKVRGLEGLKTRLGHSGTRDLDLVWMAASSNVHLPSQRGWLQTKILITGAEHQKLNGTHPERAVWDVNSAPGDHGRVFHRLAWSVATAVRAVPVILHVDIHRTTFTILAAQTHVTGGAQHGFLMIFLPPVIPEPQSSKELFLRVWHRP